MLREALLGDLLASLEQCSLRQAKCQKAFEQKELSLNKYELLVPNAAEECSEPQGKVFAFIGISLKAEEQFFAEYLPDYALNYEQVLVITFARLRSISGQEAVGPCNWWHHTLWSSRCMLGLHCRKVESSAWHFSSRYESKVKPVHKFITATLLKRSSERDTAGVA